MDKYTKVLHFAIFAHSGQERKYTGDPYIHHPIAVAKIIKDLGMHEDYQCAALLHDVVEDTNVTNQTIEQEFGIIVAKIVEQLTDVYTHEAYPNIARKERKMLECYRLSKVSGNAKTIKLADIIDNTPSIVANDPAFSKIYIPENEELLQALSGGDHFLMAQAVQVIKKAKEHLNSN